MSSNHDFGAVGTTAVLQLVLYRPRQQRCDGIEALLRNEFADVER